MSKEQKNQSLGFKHSKYEKEQWKAFLKKAQKRIESQKKYVNRTDEYAKPDETNVEVLSPYKIYDDEIIEYMRSYEKLHHDELVQAHNAYEDGKSGILFESNFRPLDESKMIQYFKRCKILIVTANPIEKAVLHHCICERNEEIIRFVCDTNVYFLFKWGEYWVVHVHQHNTGANKDLGMNTTVHEALKHVRPNVIFSLGVAFGIDHTKQNIGDVLVSHKIFPYSENKRDGDRIKPDRGQDKTIDNWLDVRFVNANGFLDDVTYGDILSGGSVLSSSTEKDRICTAYSENDFVVGGEMEGSGLFQTSYFTGIPCAVIKGICDWGVAKNDIFGDETLDNGKSKEEWFKDSLQAYAMIEVIKKCEPLFRDKTLFSSSKNKAEVRERQKNRLLFLCNVISIICMLFVGITIPVIYNLDFYDLNYEKLLFLSSLLFLVSVIDIILMLVILFKKSKWKIENHIEEKIIEKELKELLTKL